MLIGKGEGATWYVVSVPERCWYQLAHSWVVGGAVLVVRHDVRTVPVWLDTNDTSGNCVLCLQCIESILIILLSFSAQAASRQVAA